jgi:4-diphosphocytidyl-2-C-methyl-D-erythritol kinase
VRICEPAFAKINLALHVRARRADGYHVLDTVFAFADAGDRLDFAPADDLTLRITGEFAAGLSAGTDNLIIRAATALREAAGVAAGAAITLDKSLPIAAGIGGGSADAAAALRGLIRLWGLEGETLPLQEIAAALGADVPACLASTSVVGSGVGDELSPYAGPTLGGLPLLLVNPRVACPTGPVFLGWDGTDRGALDPAQWRGARNDLQISALALVPEIGTVLDWLDAQAEAQLVRMSGSGATCFALFRSAEERDAVQTRITRAHDWWSLASVLRP